MGEWIDGPTGKVIFYENGDAYDTYNTRQYHVESGSLEITYQSGNKETVDYDLWRGERIKNVPDSEREDAMIYKITAPGKMMAWNVYKEAGRSEWKSYRPSPVTKVTDGTADTGSNDSVNTDSADFLGTDFIIQAGKCEHNYEWVTTMEPTETENGEISYRCIACGDVEAKVPVSADVVIHSMCLML